MELTEQEFLHKIAQHKGILYKVSRMYFEDATDREDLVQEIILQLWKSLKSFQGKSQFSSWMYRVALNTAIVQRSNLQRCRKHTLHQLATIGIADRCDFKVRTF